MTKQLFMYREDKQMLIATNVFMRLYKDNEYLYRVCCEDLFRGYITAENEAEAIQKFFNKEY